MQSKNDMSEIQLTHMYNNQASICEIQQSSLFTGN